MRPPSAGTADIGTQRHRRDTDTACGILGGTLAKSVERGVPSRVKPTTYQIDTLTSEPVGGQGNDWLAQCLDNVTMSGISSPDAGGLIS